MTWNPIRLVQRNDRIDRIGSPHAEIGIYNLFPADELEALLHLVEWLTDRISTIDDLGIATLADQFGKQKPAKGGTKRLCREDLELICFEYVSR